MDRTSTPPAVMLCAVEPFGVCMLGCPRLPVLPPSLECSIFVGSGLKAGRPAAAKPDKKGFGKDLQVASEGPVLDVIQIMFDAPF